MTPEEFYDKINQNIVPEDGEYVDAEQPHSDTDTIMENLLISLGYKKGIDLLRSSVRWYA